VLWFFENRGHGTLQLGRKSGDAGRYVDHEAPAHTTGGLSGSSSPNAKQLSEPLMLHLGAPAQ
jgi:hypothetical protein